PTVVAKPELATAAIKNHEARRGPRADRPAPRGSGRGGRVHPARRVRPRAPALVRAVRLRGPRRDDHLLRPARPNAALRGVLPAPPAREPSRALPLSPPPEPHAVRREVLDRARRRPLSRRQGVAPALES